MRNSIGYYLGFLVLLTVWLAVWHIVRVVRKVRTLISRATDDTVAAAPSLDVDDLAALIVATREPAEPSPLLREIYAAQSLAREGVDVYSKAPKEMAP